MSPRPLRPSPAVHWAILASLLLALALGAATFDARAWPALVGDEATYLMQAESLAWDLDLTYSRRDYDRFVEHWGRAPEGLILQKGSGSSELVYGKPLFYAAWAAPFVRLSPTRGPFVANALLLALAAVAAARALRRTVGAAAPTWVALFVFASVAFDYVFWAHLDLFLMCVAALGLALVFGRPSGADGEADEEPAGRLVLRWAGAGLLLAIVAFSRPLYLPLFLPAALAAPRGRRLRALAGLAAGALLLVLAAAGIHEKLAGTWTSYGAERRSFNSTVGFPEVDFPETDWQRMIEEWGNASWLKRRDVSAYFHGDARLWTWDTIYFLAGRSVGVLPYFLPFVLGLLGRPRGWARWSLLLAVGLTAAAFFVVRPFNFYGGGGTLANRYFLPVYPALWFLPTRPVRGLWLTLVAALAAPFLWPLWSSPRGYPLDARGVFRYVSPAARAVLPFETTQNHLKPAGPRADVSHDGLWVKFLDPAVRATPDGATLLLEGAGRGELLVGDGRPLAALDLVIEAPALPLRVTGGRVVARTPDRPGWERLRIELDGPRAVHPMWWTDDDFYLYRLTLDPQEDLDRTFAFRLRPAAG